MRFGVGFTPTCIFGPGSSPFQNPKAIKSLIKERVMHPMLIVAIPIVLVIVGMVLNSIGLSFDQPPSSAEQDPAKRSAAEREDYRRSEERRVGKECRTGRAREQYNKRA